jgi:hypothetical protein
LRATECTHLHHGTVVALIWRGGMAMISAISSSAFASYRPSDVQFVITRLSRDQDALRAVAVESRETFGQLVQRTVGGENLSAIELNRVYMVLRRRAGLAP